MAELKIDTVDSGYKASTVSRILQPMLTNRFKVVYSKDLDTVLSTQTVSFHMESSSNKSKIYGFDESQNVITIAIEVDISGKVLKALDALLDGTFDIDLNLLDGADKILAVEKYKNCNIDGYSYDLSYGTTTKPLTIYLQLTFETLVRLKE
jgi:hypothetical protein